MSEQGGWRVTRRAAVVGLALTAAHRLTPALGQKRCNSQPATIVDQPLFSSIGPNAALYGADAQYPTPGFIAARLHGNPFAPRYRVGAFSHADTIYRTRTVGRADQAWPFRRRPEHIAYRHDGRASSIDDYLARNPVMGLLIAVDDAIVCERYQYGRTDCDRMLSQSMVKSITGLLAGIAVSEGAIRSVDDEAQAYVPGFRGFEYGRTRIRDLLHMASGIDFGEERDGGRDLERLWHDMVAGPLFGLGRAVASLVQFNRRDAPPGTRFRYASIEPNVLGVVIRAATHASLSDYLGEKIWRPIGAEADAAWALDAEGAEIAHFGFNAVLRDYARLGRLLAWDGNWNGRQIIPSQCMIDATTVSAADTYLAPGRATPWLGYGYLVWLLPGPRRQFAFLGEQWAADVCRSGRQACHGADRLGGYPGILAVVDGCCGSVWSKLIERHADQVRDGL